MVNLKFRCLWLGLLCILFLNVSASSWKVPSLKQNWRELRPRDEYFQASMQLLVDVQALFVSISVRLFFRDNSCAVWLTLITDAAVGSRIGRVELTNGFNYRVSGVNHYFDFDPITGWVSSLSHTYHYTILKPTLSVRSGPKKQRNKRLFTELCN